MPELRADDYQYIDRFARAYLALFNEEPDSYETTQVAFTAMRKYLTANGLPTLPVSTFNRLMQRAGGQVIKTRSTGVRRFYGVRLKRQHR